MAPYHKIPNSLALCKSKINPLGYKCYIMSSECLHGSPVSCLKVKFLTYMQYHLMYYNIIHVVGNVELIMPN